ncbi:hypothetical protein NA57DRAFT_32953 [Rhizodiscina lignyota]|uniref:Uncharacterized protein n=1 Tax=Rhizodiscina lignyota TaxID=1504668 RepID=A0A9P4IPM4_9PEZI|nr:hypothetical protein NA57DRAFT_32953 [Rhizodiscina lignyota]
MESEKVLLRVYPVSVTSILRYFLSYIYRANNYCFIFFGHNLTCGRYINNVSGILRHEAPPPFSGGIVSDHMGLGKSLSMIALMASDLEQHFKLSSDNAVTDERQVSATLLVVPSALLGSWEAQIAEHLQPRSLILRRHHSKSRVKTIDDISECHLVISTFETIASEWRRPSNAKSILFSVEWHRIILDEAHCIRNSTTATSRAACALKARSRWAVTGTPIQNKLSDLASLLRFLRIYPYADRITFDSDIVQKWKDAAEDVAIDRLKKLLSYVMLRRSGSAIQLPARHDRIEYLHFTHEERIHYDSARAQAIQAIDEQLQDETHGRPSYVNVLQRVNALRKICNLGIASMAPVAEVPCSISGSSKVSEWCQHSASAGIQSVRLDGKVTPKNRATALKRLREEPEIKVLLLSMSCGAVGLTLTAASRAFLFEPHWNPTMEEQALARIHRIGQTREVTTVRYVIKDSYEEHVVKVQDRKKSLAEILFSKGKASERDLTISRLHHLRSLLD